MENNILMEDLLKEITTLSSKLDESQSDSNSTSAGRPGQQILTGVQGIDLLQMRNKSRSKKRRGRKRRMDCHPELYSESESSFSDSSEDGAIRDYIENITTGSATRPSTSSTRQNLSDSDEDFVPRRKATNLFNTGVPWSPLDVGESDSFSENIMSLSSRKKRKIKKMNKKLKELESLEQIRIPDGEINMREKIGQLRKDLEENHKKLKKRRQKTLKNSDIDLTNIITDNANLNLKHQKMLTDSDDEFMNASDISSDEASDVQNQSKSSSNEADDEGEESCVETAIPSVIPYWDHESMCEDDGEKQFNLVLSQSFGLLSDDYAEDLQMDVQKRSHIMPPPKINDNNFIIHTNKRVRSFLHNADERELYLNSFCDNELDQILELACLYSLSTKIETYSSKKRIILTKTKNTKEPDGRLLKKLLKKESRRRVVTTAPSRWISKRRKIVATETFSTENVVAIPDSNVGSQMLRSMGWIPGNGLGKDGNGIVKPVAAHRRPRKLGLGYPS
eukprot:gene17407-19150_t